MQDDMGRYARSKIGDYIVQKFEETKSYLHAEFMRTDRIQSCYVDNLLPPEIAEGIYAAFPTVDRLVFKNTLRERKYIGAQMDKYDPVLEECIYAFQDPRVVELVSEITEIDDLEADEFLYAGGISAMHKGNYLRPHLDNSHDKNRDRYRVLNLLYYVTPGWREEFGGNLELWDRGPKGDPRVIVSVFNRLTIMITHEASWHSVNQVLHDDGKRCCVSNYYFSKEAPTKHDYFHVTSFRGRAGEVMIDTILNADVLARTAVRKMFKKGIVENPHVYKRGKQG
jgi:Rps23 Pro-64 3,4-dihydroxylase Tpa1-like proline 4-hydroxylase